MARVYLLRDSTFLSVLYNVDQAVGRGCPNQRDDVSLVQFFVRRILEGWNDIPPGKPLAIDGFFGDQTHQYIQHFLQGEQKRGRNFAQDNIISPIADRSYISPQSKKVYTMVRLNTFYAERWGNAWHANISIDPLCPQLPSIFWN